MGKVKIIDIEGIFYAIVGLGFLLTFADAFKTLVASILGTYANAVTSFISYGVVGLAMMTVIIFLLYMISGYLKSNF